MDIQNILEYKNITLYIFALCIAIYIIYTHFKFKNKIEEIDNNISLAGPKDWKDDEWGIFFLNVIKTDKLYKDNFSELGTFKDINEKESLIHSLLTFLTLAEADRKDIILKEFVGNKEEPFVKHFVDFWFKNEEKFKKTEEYENIYK